MIDFVYRPEVQADIAEYVNYICPVRGRARRSSTERDPALASNQLIFPDDKTLSNAFIFRRAQARGGAGARRGLPAGDRRLAAPCPRASRRAGLPYCCSCPGLGWLLLFFAIPLGYMAFESLKSGTLETGYLFTWEFSNYTDAISDFSEQFLRSFEYAAMATIAALLIGYPLAYVIAFRGGRWRNALLLAVIAPFFVTYLIRTLSWETILSDSGSW